ncbi:ABC transporter substrate-binding protein [Prevotella sp. PCHR]|uniref:ABC transporter substrate-binding protein n=2 Tax=Xylanibacter caecicola TaxID=2736294 RepID=A0ABX2B564_9BACT|nr:ABC transporter substrate-binding protein [Xylanibacter caecicola]NPE25380.1 ABC transporter substrate-binding protein [Xylanibacter caecicola]
MRRVLKYIVVCATVLISSCSGKTTAGHEDAGDSMTMKYAEHIKIVKHRDYTTVTLTDPWNAGKTLHTYILVKKGTQHSGKLPQGTVIRIPLEKSVISTSVHSVLLLSLKRENSIAGVCDVPYIKNARISLAVKNGSIADCGSSMAPAIEKIIELHPDAILLSPFRNSGGYGKIDKLGIPVIEAADYMETTALGRAEWMKFYGLLWGAEERADSIFNAVEKEYMELKTLAKTSRVSNSILMDTKTGSVWYVPGGRSTIGQIIKDAEIAYPFADNDNSGSLQLSFEKVLESSSDAGIWMLRYAGDKPLALDALGKEYNGYRQFKAFKTGEVYGCNTLHSTFYEETPFHPERLLRDFVMIAHPDLGIKGDTKYFFKLK